MIAVRPVRPARRPRGSSKSAHDAEGRRMMRDSLRDAFRACRADPWTTLTIVVTLGIGTGVNAAVLALVYGILLRPLPYRDPSRLVVIDEEMRFSQLAPWSAAMQTADSMAAYS